MRSRLARSTQLEKKCLFKNCIGQMNRTKIRKRQVKLRQLYFFPMDTRYVCVEPERDRRAIFVKQNSQIRRSSIKHATAGIYVYCVLQRRANIIKADDNSKFKNRVTRSIDRSKGHEERGEAVSTARKLAFTRTFLYDRQISET